MAFCLTCQAQVQTIARTQGGVALVCCGLCGLPIEEVEAPRPKRAPQPAAVPPPEPATLPHVLFIDDDTRLTRILGRVLQERGFRVSTAADGATGLACAQRETPDLILCDLTMPGLDGYEVCRRCREDESLRATPIILFTATRDPELSMQAFVAGADVALTKPVDASKLVTVLQAALALRARRSGA